MKTNIKGFKNLLLKCLSKHFASTSLFMLASICAIVIIIFHGNLTDISIMLDLGIFVVFGFIMIKTLDKGGDYDYYDDCNNYNDSNYDCTTKQSEN